MIKPFLHIHSFLKVLYLICFFFTTSESNKAFKTLFPQEKLLDTTIYYINRVLKTIKCKLFSYPSPNLKNVFIIFVLYKRKIFLFVFCTSFFAYSDIFILISSIFFISFSLLDTYLYLFLGCSCNLSLFFFIIFCCFFFTLLIVIISCFYL